jgi:hypothetical protein
VGIRTASEKRLKFTLLRRTLKCSPFKLGLLTIQNSDKIFYILGVNISR